MSESNTNSDVQQLWHGSPIKNKEKLKNKKKDKKNKSKRKSKKNSNVDDKSTSFLQLTNSALDKSVIIDLQDLTKGTSVIVKGNNLKAPVSLTNGGNENTVQDKAVGDSVSDGDSQTNSGIIFRSQFNDGGFGDIGQQWHRVHLHNSTVINNHTSINLTLGDNGSIRIDGNTFGTDHAKAGHKIK
jgi:hypothetical protein